MDADEPRMDEAQLTLVALHGERPAALQSLIEGCVADILAICGARFARYAPEQLHATLLGLESDVLDGVRVHRNLLEHHGERASLDLDCFVRKLLRERFSFQLRFGGFAAGATPFTSRGLPPYERGFSIQGDSPAMAVLIGWPEVPGPPPQFPETLDALRRRARTFGIAHAYHRRPDDRDNDLYLRLGLFREGLPETLRRATEERVRARLAAHGPVRARVAPRDLRIVVYRDPELPARSSAAYRLDGLDLSPAGLEVLLRTERESG